MERAARWAWDPADRVRDKDKVRRTVRGRKVRAVDVRTANDERELVRRARLKDVRAFSALVVLYQERAIHSAYSFIGNYEDARDVAQEAFVKAYENLDRFNEESRFFTWLYRILANTAKDHLRKKKVRGHLTLRLGPAEEGEPDPMESLARTDTTAREKLGADEIGGGIRRAMDELPERQRLAFSLRYLDGLTLEETAQSMAISVGAAKANLWQALQKMKKILAVYAV